MLAYLLCRMAFFVGIFNAISSFAIPHPIGLYHARIPQKRQTGLPSSLPSQCQSLCTSVNSAVTQGCPASVCCNAAFEMEYFNCFLCVAKALNVTDFSVPQIDVDMLFNDCASAGSPIPKLTYPGQNPDRTLSSVPDSFPPTPSTTSHSQVSPGISQPFGLPGAPTASAVSFAGPAFSQVTITASSPGLPPLNSDTPSPTSTATRNFINIGTIVVSFGVVFFRTI